MGKKILIVDDEKKMLNDLQKKLTSEGYEVSTEETAKGGLARAKDFLPDVIFLDILLPDMDGPEVAQLLQNDSTLKTIPLVVMSGIVTGKDGTRKSEVKVGGVNYRALGKPFTYRDLEEEIEYVCGP
jgi:DNA-binding response OmpR family regulator